MNYSATTSTAGVSAGVSTETSVETSAGTYSVAWPHEARDNIANKAATPNNFFIV